MGLDFHGANRRREDREGTPDHLLYVISKLSRGKSRRNHRRCAGSLEGEIFEKNAVVHLVTGRAIKMSDKEVECWANICGAAVHLGDSSLPGQRSGSISHSAAKCCGWCQTRTAMGALPPISDLHPRTPFSEIRAVRRGSTTTMMPITRSRVRRGDRRSSTRQRLRRHVAVGVDEKGEFD